MSIERFIAAIEQEKLDIAEGLATMMASDYTLYAKRVGVYQGLDKALELLRGTLDEDAEKQRRY